ncbi:MAG: hypothetical protein ACKVX9_03565, partial [Blastocatellia bacterium]
PDSAKVYRPCRGLMAFMSIPAVTLRFTAGYRLVFLRNTTMRRLSINIAKLCPTFNHTPDRGYRIPCSSRAQVESENALSQPAKRAAKYSHE